MFTIPVGQGDGTVIKCPNDDGYMSIIDMGQMNGKGLVHKDDLIKNLGLDEDGNGKLFWGKNICKLENIFLTHKDRDHTSFIPEILEKFKKECTKKLNIYISGELTSYNKKLKDHLNNHHVWEAKADRGNEGYTCGYF